MIDFEFARRVVIGVCNWYLNVQMFTYIGKNHFVFVRWYHVMLIFANLFLWLYNIARVIALVKIKVFTHLYCER